MPDRIHKAAEASRLPEDPSEEDWRGRTDLRGIPLVTIDPDDARDHDDAVHVRRRDDGGYVATIRVLDADNHMFFSGSGPSAAAEYGPAQHLDPAAVVQIADWIAAGSGHVAR